MSYPVFDLTPPVGITLRSVGKRRLITKAAGWRRHATRAGMKVLGITESLDVVPPKKVTELLPAARTNFSLHRCALLRFEIDSNGAH